MWSTKVAANGGGLVPGIRGRQRCRRCSTGSRSVACWRGELRLRWDSSLRGLSPFAPCDASIAISDTVARMGSDDLSSRLPEGQHPDEITRLSRTFNRMLGPHSSVGQPDAHPHRFRGARPEEPGDLDSRQPGSRFVRRYARASGGSVWPKLSTAWIGFRDC